MDLPPDKCNRNNWALPIDKSMSDYTRVVFEVKYCIKELKMKNTKYFYVTDQKI